jgi:hypothetical protein
MSRHRVHCKQLSNLHQEYNKIEFIGGINSDGTRWKVHQSRAIEGIESGKWEFYVLFNLTEVDLIVSSINGVKYLKTKNDGIEPNNLLNLPDCI